MKYEYLTHSDTRTLTGLVKGGELRKANFPVGGTLAWDSMGVVRNAKTDRFFPGVDQALGRFSERMQLYNSLIIVTTNGPDIEGIDFLNTLVKPVDAFAVTEGGGKIILMQPSGQLENRVIAHPGEMEKLSDLETEMKKHPLMAALLEDRQADEHPPIRTPYTTNVVLTLPPKPELLQSRLAPKGIDIRDFIPGYDPSAFVHQVLGFARGQFSDVINHDKTTYESLCILVKEQNRRIYILPKHLKTPFGKSIELSKWAGATYGTFAMQEEGWLPEYQRYDIEDSIYTADKAVDQTTEGEKVIGASEASMIVRDGLFLKPISPDANAIGDTKYEDDEVKFSKMSSRLAINITLDESPPSVEYVQGVPVLHLGSGLKALEALEYLYQQIHG